MGSIDYIQNVTDTRDLIRLVEFYKDDGDHVLHRRFHRLHLYNLYQKHNTLVQLDAKLRFMENSMVPDEKDGKLDPKVSKEQVDGLDNLLHDIEKALGQFGKHLN
jgi:hypothetical protein